MSYKIQSRTIFGWMDVMGDFDTIKEAQERIPFLQEKLCSVQSGYQLTSIFKIVDSEELGINDWYVYPKE
jgi:hypothetical protein